MVANWDIQKPIFLNVASDVSRATNQKGDVFLSGGVSGALLAHFILVSFAFGLGIIAFILGLFTFRSKPIFPHQALVHKQVGRIWMWIMVIIGFQSAFIVEAGTPNFVVVLISLLYSTMIIGVQLIRTRGDLREYWSSDKDSLAKDEAKQVKHDKIIKWMKIGHAVAMGLSYLLLFVTAIARYPGMRARYGQEPYSTSLCVLDPKGCFSTQLCYPSWMNTLTKEANLTVVTLPSPFASS